jgi:hypothetical protein
MADFGSFLAELRAHGVTEISLKLSLDASPGLTLKGDYSAGMAEIPPEELARMFGDAPAEDKPAGTCAAPGCGAPNGHRFAPELCREHALAAAGVT